MMFFWGFCGSSYVGDSRSAKPYSSALGKKTAWQVPKEVGLEVLKGFFKV